MKTTLTTYEAADLLVTDEYANWSIAGASALAKHFEQIEDETGEEVEFNRVEIRCNWGEYASLAEFREEYFADDKQAREAIGAEAGGEDGEELDTLTAEYIRKKGWLIEFDGGIIVSSF